MKHRERTTPNEQSKEEEGEEEGWQKNLRARIELVEHLPRNTRLRVGPQHCNDDMFAT